MKQRGENYDRLRRCVEQMLGMGEIRKTPQFALLSGYLVTHCHAAVSVTTLKRFWGVIEQSETSKGIHVYTLNALARLCGYIDYDAFCQDRESSGDSTLSSTICIGGQILAERLPKSTLLKMMWRPNRCLTVRYDGMDVFTVLESINSKIQTGATFHCQRMTEGEPLVLDCLINPGQAPVNYACAKGKGGLHVEILSSEES